MLKIMKVSEIIPSPTNPRQALTPQDDEYQQIKKSIERFDVVEPLIVNEVNNHCVSGNSRLNVLKDMGKEEAPCLIINEPDMNREIALTIALNKIKGNGIGRNSLHCFILWNITTSKLQVSTATNWTE
jgi:ParB-like chromosome segregation protein Spo0J